METKETRGRKPKKLRLTVKTQASYSVTKGVKQAFKTQCKKDGVNPSQQVETLITQYLISLTNKKTNKQK